jgi:Cof subfamily protein (haloacid dehalogenase superfamily)
MGKFTGLLLASDYDNTLTYTEEALRLCRPMPPVSKTNQAAIRYFMAEGGIFSVATGRAKPAFEAVADGVPMNGPTVLFNGAAIYDFSTGKYLCEAFLPETARAHIAQTIRELPFAAVELYHDNNDIHALQPNDVTRRHLHVTHSPTVIVDSMEQVPSPISKALFSTEPAHQAALLDYLRGQGWYGDYEIVASSESLVELTARGANKGGMVRRLAALLHIPQANVACVGDHANDISMLTWAGMAFAPANALPEVRALPCVRTLPDCREDAIAALIAVLDEKF